jgi:hypothetical protein
MVEERKIVIPPEEEVRWFFTHLDSVTLEMCRGIFKVIFSFNNRRRRYELKILRENALLFTAEGATPEAPIQMLENHALFLKLVAKTLREVAAPLEKLQEERKQEEEHEE